MSLKGKLQRHFSLAVVAVLLVAGITPMLMGKKASAYGLVSERFIKISDSTVSATDVTYQVGFKPATTTTIGGIVVTFCSNSPIIGDTCNAPAGFSSNINNLALANISASFGTGWAVDTTNSTANTIVLTDATPQSFTSGTAGTFDLGSTGVNDGVTNPSSLGTFYARILTYDTDAHAQNYSGGGTPSAPNPGTGNVDAGGAALSTARQITITSKVQERLTFCIYRVLTTETCSTSAPTSVALGDTNGVLDPAGPYVDVTSRYDIATNASSGAAIRIKGDTLKSGSFSISAIGGTAAASNPGNEQFGFCTWQSAGTGLVPATPYDDAGCSSTTQTAGTNTPGGAGGALFAFNTANTTSTYGDIFANKPAGSTSTGTLAFIGNISNTTEAGIYTTTLTFIATGTY